jgi:hypothetical protein
VVENRQQLPCLRNFSYIDPLLPHSDPQEKPDIKGGELRFNSKVLWATMVVMFVWMRYALTTRCYGSLTRHWDLLVLSCSVIVRFGPFFVNCARLVCGQDVDKILCNIFIGIQHGGDDVFRIFAVCLPARPVPILCSHRVLGSWPVVLAVHFIYPVRKVI